jgi:hypothetical protein
LQDQPSLLGYLQDLEGFLLIDGPAKAMPHGKVGKHA